jgi:lysophospholipase L1-like esterase
MKGMGAAKTCQGLAVFTAFLLVLTAWSCRLAPEQVIVCFGNSLTAGKGARPDESYPALLQQRVKAKVVNAGVSGDTIGEALERIDTDVLAHNPDLVVIELGANDFLDALNGKTLDMGSLYGEYKSIVEKLSGGNRKIYLVKFYTREMAQAWLGNNLELYKRFEEMYAALAAEYHTDIIENIWEGIWPRPDLMSDDIHPNAEGYRIMAEHYLEALRPWLEERKLLK